MALNSCIIILKSGKPFLKDVACEEMSELSEVWKWFEEVNHYEETEVLPEGFYVTGIVIANINSCKEYVG